MCVSLPSTQYRCHAHGWVSGPARVELAACGSCIVAPPTYYIFQSSTWSGSSGAPWGTARDGIGLCLREYSGHSRSVQLPDQLLRCCSHARSGTHCGSDAAGGVARVSYRLALSSARLGTGIPNVARGWEYAASGPPAQLCRAIPAMGGGGGGGGGGRLELLLRRCSSHRQS